MRLDGKVALGVGIADEVGCAIACALAAAGARVALVDTADAQINSVVERLRAQSTPPLCIGSSQGSDWLDSDLSEWGGVDILVQDLQDPVASQVDFLSMASVDETIGHHLHRRFDILRQVIPVMRRAGRGRIINVVNLSYLGCTRNVSAAAVGGAVCALTRALALDVAFSGVTVNCVVKGDIATTATTDVDRERLAGSIPVRRLGVAADVARAVCFFASDGARYITGQTLFVCGGKSAFASMSV